MGRAWFGVLFMVLFASCVFAGGDQTTTVSPSSVEAGSSSVLLNFSVRNDHLDEDIKMLEITMSSDFDFIQGSNLTTASGTDFSYTSYVLRWNSSSGSGFMAPGQTRYFVFNVSTPLITDEFSFDVKATFTNNAYDIEYIALTVQDTTLPANIVLVPPSSNNSLNAHEWVFVNVSFTEVLADQCVLEWSNGSANNITMSLAGSSYCYYNVSQEDGSPSFKVYVKDTSDNWGMNMTWFATVDASPPTSVTNVTPTLANNSFTNNSWVFVNFSFSESNPSSCILELSNGTNLSAGLQGNYCYHNISGLSDSVLAYRVWINDSVNSWGSSGYWLCTVDTYSPRTISFVTPSQNGSSSYNDYFFVNASFDEPNVDSCVLESGSNSSMTVSGSYCSVNVTELSYGSYYFRVWVFDSSGKTGAGDYYSLTLVCPENWTCTDWSECSGEVQARTCTDSNSCGTTVSKPLELVSCGEAPEEDVQRSSMPSVIITPFRIVSEDYDELVVSNINFNLRNFSGDLNVDVQVLESSPVSSVVSGVVYNYFEVVHDDLGSAELSGVNISFSVNKSWVESRGVNVSSVSLYRYSGSWTRLETRLVSEGENGFGFTAESPGLSFFAVSAVLLEGVAPSFCGDGVCSDDESWVSCPDDCLRGVNVLFGVANSFLANKDYLVLLIVYVGSVVLMFLILSFLMFRGSGKEVVTGVSRVEFEAVKDAVGEIKRPRWKRLKKLRRTVRKKPVKKRAVKKGKVVKREVRLPARERKSVARRPKLRKK